LITLPELVWTLPFFLYAETHYRFKYFLSWLRKAEPEIIADAPHRVDPHADIPLLILAKDADKFPATLAGVGVTMRQAGKIVGTTHLIKNAISLSDPLWWNVYTLSREGLHGWIELEVSLTLTIKGRSRVYGTDNHRTSSHAPLRVFLSSDSLPQVPGTAFGDAHIHSDRTSDQVEFGVPIGAATTLSRSMGLSFFCVTDHSYDLDDSVDDYLKNDPTLPKWNSLKQEVRNINSGQQNIVIIQGEEISCRNSNERNVHLLLFGDDQFFEGSGDSAERWFHTKCELRIADVLRLKHLESLAFAAHPKEHVSLLQRLLLGRGTWTMEDCRDSRLVGIQFANGIRGKGFAKGFNLWVNALLDGRRLYCLAGNDAHGNFNRFRQIGFPFLRIREHSFQLFGKMRTAVFAEAPLDQSRILKSLARGAFNITDGPFANIVLTSKQGMVTSIGDHFEGSNFEFTVSIYSSREFGEIKNLKVMWGEIGTEAERILLSEQLSAMFTYQRDFKVHVVEAMYIRAEVVTSNRNDSDQSEHFCITNPIWFSPKPAP